MHYYLLLSLLDRGLSHRGRFWRRWLGWSLWWCMDGLLSCAWGVRWLRSSYCGLVLVSDYLWILNLDLDGFLLSCGCWVNLTCIRTTIYRLDIWDSLAKHSCESSEIPALSLTVADIVTLLTYFSWWGKSAICIRRSRRWSICCCHDIIRRLKLWIKFEAWGRRSARRLKVSFVFSGLGRCDSNILFNWRLCWTRCPRIRLTTERWP